MLPQQYCLRWKYHHSNLQTMFSQLLDRGCFCDVTLACEGQVIRAHRVVLCACSTFFDTVLTNYASDRDPIIIMKDVTFADVKCLIEFMYKGEINVEHNNLASLLKTADDLKIKGLAEVSWREEEFDVPPVPPEYHSPSLQQENIPQNNQHSTKDVERANNSSPTVSNRGGDSRMPMLTPIPSVSVVTENQHHHQQHNHHHVGPKRKRGRPPLDDTYDVFNVPKVSHLEPSPVAAAHKYSDSRLHMNHHQPSTHEDPSHSHSSYLHLHRHHHQHHLQQQQQHLQKHSHPISQEETEEVGVTHEVQPDPEWIKNNLEANAGDCDSVKSESGGVGVVDRVLDQQQEQRELQEEEKSTKQEYYENALREKHLQEAAASDEQQSTLPQPIEEIEKKQEMDPLECSEEPSSSEQPLKYPEDAADAIQELSGTSNADDHEYRDMKMDDFETSDLRLTNEEMAKWNDVVKMDAYLAKGRRPQFWEEPFTRRVLDAIKNKKLEMKKAAKVLGVSYGTLYGRYREVYGCLKHPYSAAFRGNRYDVLLDKRASGLMPLPLEVGKIRPKDLSELWMRPQL